MENQGTGHGEMIKKKAKSKAGKRTSKKSGTKKRKKELNPAEVRKNIEQMVASEAEEMTTAAIGEGKKGQLATFKYLMEVGKIFPAPTDGSESSTEEDSLARTLLRRMELPEEPVVREDEDAVKAAPVDDSEGKAKATDEAAEVAG